MAKKNWSDAVLVDQYKRIKLAGWLPHFLEAAPRAGVRPSVLIAIGSRETNLRNIVGDGGHGVGIMQIDDRSFPSWTSSGAWKNVRLAIFKGAEVLAAKRHEIENAKGRKVTIRGRNGTLDFVGADFTPDELLWISLASYNSGMRAYYWFGRAHDPDRGTTGADYGRDVLDRAAVFERLLEADGHLANLAPKVPAEPPPVAPQAPTFAPDVAAKAIGPLAGAAATSGLVATTSPGWPIWLHVALLVVALVAVIGFVIAGWVWMKHRRENAP